MIEQQKKFNCSSCRAACCRKGVVMPLSSVEADFLRSGGASLTELVPPVDESRRPVRFLPIVELTLRGQDGTFRLDTDCGYLVTSETGQQLCSVYEDPDRPRICEDFQPESYGCRTIRAQSGVDSSQEYDKFLRESVT